MKPKVTRVPRYRRLWIFCLGAMVAVALADDGVGAADTAYLQLERSYSLVGKGVGLDVAASAVGTVYISSPSLPGLWRLDQDTGEFLPITVYQQEPGSQVQSPLRLFPEAIEFDGQGRLWIADATLRQVHIVSDAGNLVTAMGSPELPLDTPIGLTRLGNHGMAVWDRKAGMFWRFSAALEPFDSQRLEPAPYCTMLGAKHSVCVTTDERELVVYQQGQPVARHILEGEDYSRIGDLVPGMDGQFYVSDISGKRLLSFSSELDVLQRFYLYESLFRSPTRFAIQDDRLWLIDEGREELLHFTLRTAETALEYALLGEEYLVLGYYQPALNALNTALRMGHGEDAIRLLKGRALYGLQRYLEALAEFEPLTGSQPEFWYGNTRFHLGHYGEAIRAYQNALQYEPDNPLILFNLAQSLLEVGRYADAEGVYRELVIAMPDHLHARLGLARSVLGQGDHDAAMEILQMLANEDTIGRQARHYLGLAHLAADAPETALPWLERAAQEGPYFKEALGALAEANRRLGRFAQARHHEQQMHAVDRQAEQLGDLILEEIL